jgi:thiamine-monophosphate kinase
MKAPRLYSRSLRGSVSSLGEEALIRSIRRWLGAASLMSPAGIGDDCAVLRPARGRELLTVDPLIHGVHFDEHVTARAAGAKLFKRNLSDIAAMGGRPRAALVALALDARVSLEWLAEFYRGMAAESLRHGVPIVGGDVARLKGAFVATLALTGEARGRVLTRAGSRAGDWIYVTGSLGNSLASGHHFQFQPRLAEGAWLARRAEVRAMIDVSDGLAKDVRSLAPDIRGALCDGEDYELLFSVASGARRGPLEDSWRRAFPRTRLSCVGMFARSGAVPKDALRLGDYHGYDHLG